MASAPAGIDCGSICTEHFDEGSTVTLTASPAIHNQVAWSGCDAEPGPTECEVTIGTAESVSAAFTPIHHSLAVSVVGGGSVSAGSGIVSGCTSSAGTCSGTYAEGEAIALSATPAVGFAFAGWSGACGGTGPCHLTIAADTAVTANFAALPPAPVPARLSLGKLTVNGAGATLKASVSGPGTVSAAGSNLKSAATTASAAGSVSLPLALSAAGKRALARRGKLKVEVTLTFAPADGGAAAIAAKAVVFKAGRARKPHSTHGRH